MVIQIKNKFWSKFPNFGPQLRMQFIQNCTNRKLVLKKHRIVGQFLVQQ
jgi:hypothetical protein